MRKKEVVMDGDSHMVSPLTVEQAEAYMQELSEIFGEKDSLTPEQLAEPKLGEKLKVISRKLVAMGLNNAHVLRWDNGEPAYEEGYRKWTPERVRIEIDLLFLDKLREEIFSLSGLKVVSVGEAKAAS